jgi:hypothetical protein
MGCRRFGNMSGRFATTVIRDSRSFRLSSCARHAILKSSYAQCGWCQPGECQSAKSGAREQAPIARGQKRVPLWVKGGIVLAFSEKTALGSRSRLDEYGVARKPAQPLSTRCHRRRQNKLNTLLRPHEGSKNQR